LVLSATRDGPLIRTLASAPATFVVGWRVRLSTPYCGFHGHPEFEFVYHLGNEGETRIRGQETIRFRHGDVVLYPPRAEHDQTTPVLGDDLCVRFTLPAPIPAPLGQPLHLPGPHAPAVQEEAMLLTAMPPRRSAAEQIASDLRTTALLVEVLGHARTDRRADTEARGTDIARQARPYSRRHFDTLASMEEVARHLGISYDHLRHVFRKTFGMSLVNWLATVRIERARELLASSPLPLKAVAGLCGFANERYFCTCFRKATGISPGAFRRQQRQE